MIARIQGVLESVQPASVMLRVEGGLTYEVLVSSYAAGRLGGSIGQSVSLHTLYFIQSEGQGTSFIPRLAGFMSLEDKRFFELFTSAKGIGARRALRALALSTSQIAAAIADRDAALLQSLPEIGKRTAETIIAALSGKVDAFLAAPAEAAAPTGRAGAAPADVRSGSIAREALDALVQLGENRAQALTWIEQALSKADDRTTDVSTLLARVYQLKAGG